VPATSKLLKSFSPTEAAKRVTQETTLFWFRRDLRLSDNAGLYHALRKNTNVLPIFIFDTEILDQLEDKQDRRVSFILDSLAILKKSLEETGSSLLIIHGNPIDFFKKAQPKAVCTNEDYEPYARKRDDHVSGILRAKKSVLHIFKDQVIFSKDEILKDDGSPYTIFTPYSRKWKAALKPFHYKSYPTEKYFKNFRKLDPLPFRPYQRLDLKRRIATFPKGK
jgi:deoxyribodipyrimidine photo-lyase